MKLCPECGTSYEARVEFCFKDGTPLSVDAPPVAAPVAAPEPKPAAVTEPEVPDPTAPPEPSSAPAVAAVADPTDVPMPRGLGDVFDVPEPRFAPLRAAMQSPSEGDTRPVSVAQSPLVPLAEAPAETADLPSPPEQTGPEVLSAPRALEETAPLREPSADAPSSGLDEETLAGPTPIEAPKSRGGLVRPPRPAHERAVPGTQAAQVEPPPEAAVPPPEPAAEPTPDLSGFAAMPDAPEDEDEPDEAVAMLPPPPASGGSNTGILVGIAAAALALVAIGVWWMSQPAPQPPPEPARVIAPAPEAPPAPVPAPAPPPAPEPEPEPEPEVEPEPTPEPVEVEPAPAPAPARQPDPPRKPTPPPPEPTRDGTADASPWGGGAETKSEGTLSISTTPPGATVFLDNSRIGVAPLDRRVAHGSHTVRVELKGFKGDARAVQLTSDRLAVSFELRAEVAMGRVALFGVPQSSVQIDGVPAGQIPFQTSLSEGTHLFKVTTPDGESFSTTKEVRFGSDGRAVTINLAAP